MTGQTVNQILGATKKSKPKKEFNRTEYFKIQFIVIGVSLLIGFAFKSATVAIFLAVLSGIVLNVIATASFKAKKQEAPDLLKKNHNSPSLMDRVTDPKYHYLGYNNFNYNKNHRR